MIGLNTARFDATKHHSMALVADARETLADSVSLGTSPAEGARVDENRIESMAVVLGLEVVESD